MSLLKKQRELDKLYKKYDGLRTDMIIKASLKHKKEMSFAFYGYSNNTVCIRHDRGVFYLSIKEAEALKKYLTKLLG